MEYKIIWSTDHASGALPGVYPNKTEATRVARNWKREMVEAEGFANRRDARREYQWELIEVNHDQALEDAAALEEQSLDYFNYYIAGDR